MELTVAQIKGRIKSVAKKTNSDARPLLRLYMMDRFLDRLACSNYKDNFILKGGVLVTSMVGVAMRSTMDIDTSIKNLNLTSEDALKVIKEIIGIDLNDGITFVAKKAERIMDSFEYPGIRIEVDAIIGDMTTPIKIDISTGDVITPKEIRYEYTLLLENRKITLWAYNLETVLAEKLQTILERDVLNTRMRDFYDIHALMNLYGDRIDQDVFLGAFNATTEKRNSKFSNVEKQIQVIGSNETILKLWENYQKKYSYASDISFVDVVESIRVLAQKTCL